MSILSRFNDIIKANINALLDKAEDPAKMIDQYLREMTDDLAEVKRETASVMAEETRTMRHGAEHQAQVDKYDALARKALQAGNETDARVFLARKQELEAAGAGLKTAYAAAQLIAVRTREKHDKLARVIDTLTSRRQSITAKGTGAKPQEKLTELSSASEKVNGAMGAFERMEEKANAMLDEATSMSELNNFSVDEALKLEEKYAKENAPSVDDALAKLKEEMGL